MKGVGLASRDLLSELRGLRDAVKDIAKSMEERRRAYYLLQEAVETVHPIRKMLEEDASPKVDLGGRLIRLGVIMIALPLPIISEVPGAFLLAGGIALKKIVKESPSHRCLSRTSQDKGGVDDHKGRSQPIKSDIHSYLQIHPHPILEGVSVTDDL